jgi:predicted neutral ceramidase superfamily lipid hydrolase
MPDGRRDVTHFTRYFRLDAPKVQYLALVIILLGIIAGIAMELILHSTYSQGTALSIIYGASSGIVVISLPAILTALLLKGMRRKLKLKHSFVAVLAITTVYCLFLIIMSAVFRFTHNYALAYLVLLLSNAGIYGYWFMINRVVLNQRKSQVLTAAVQPMLNILLYLPASPYLLAIQIPVNVLLIKLWAGMLVFMFCGYAILYVMDRPAKRQLNFSGVDLMSSMIHQWLYDANISKSNDALEGSGVKRDVPVQMLSIFSNGTPKAVFVKPEIHYGPIKGVGGSAATEYIGAGILCEGAVPFVMHGLVNIEDNPISNSQIPQISKAVAKSLGAQRTKASAAYGSIGTGSSGPCTATAIRVNDSCIVVLTKAPMITEDINRDVGISFTEIAKGYVKNAIVIDAHNSRFESAPADELLGVYKDSKYVAMYKNAITSAMKSVSTGRQQRLMFGSASAPTESKPKARDIGNGPLSACVFAYGRKRFCMVYFDANNMLPSFRSEVLKHIKNKFGIDAELCTTDTHAVNTLSLPASNVLGRETRPNAVLPVIDALITKSLSCMKPVHASYSEPTLKNFKVWGKGSEDLMIKVSRDVIHTGKRRLPLIITGFFILAMWIIYVA